MSDLQQSYAALRPKSLQLKRQADAVLAGGVGHDLRCFAPVPLYVARAKRGRKWDVDGNEYVDFLLGNGALLLGHADEGVLQAIRDSLAEGTHFGSDHPRHIAWAALVCELVPSAERVRFVNSGSEAAALAIRLARAFTGKSRLLRFAGHFHGWLDDVVHGFAPPFEADGSLGVAPGVRGQTTIIPDGDLNRLADVLSRDADLAAIILEPTGASWGRVPLDREFLVGLRDLASRRGVVVIFDEVVSGFRYSPGGAQSLYGVTPDLTCMAKVMAGGMPGGAVGGRADIMALFDYHGDSHRDRFQRVVHLGTFNASPPSAAAGIAVLERVRTGEPTARASALAASLRDAFNDVLERSRVAGYAYGEASTFHVYFETDPDRVRGATTRDDLRTRDPARLKGMPAPLVDQYQRRLRMAGMDIMSSTGGVLSSSHTEADLSWAAEAFEKTVLALRDERLVLEIGAS